MTEPSIRRFRVDVTIWISNPTLVQSSDRQFLSSKAVIRNLEGKIKVEVTGPVIGGGSQPMRSKVFNIKGYPQHPRMPSWLSDIVNEAMTLKEI